MRCGNINFRQHIVCNKWHCKQTLEQNKQKVKQQTLSCTTAVV